MTPGPWQIILIVVIVLLLFGAGKIPRLMRDFGTGINAFKKGLKESQITEADTDPEQPPKPLNAEGAAAAEGSAKNDEAAKS